MFNIRVEYPSRAEEIQIMKATTTNQKPEVAPVLDSKQIQRLQEAVRQVVVADHVFHYAADLVRSTRPKEAGVPKFVPDLVAWGAGPRASQFLILGGKAGHPARPLRDDGRHPRGGVPGLAASTDDDVQRGRRGDHHHEAIRRLISAHRRRKRLPRRRRASGTIVAFSRPAGVTCPRRSLQTLQTIAICVRSIARHPACRYRAEVPLRQFSGAADPGVRNLEANPLTCHSAGMERRVDLPICERPHSSSGP